jgi:DNA-binding NtrC family response regulator
MQQILVVDDEIGIRELLSEILSDEGYQVRLAENASSARACRSQVRPDLVLLDIWMPDTDGITLLKEWAAAGLLTMPVVMMSGHGTIDTAVEATRIGAYDFLEKPIAMQKLLATVGRALKHGGEQAQSALSLASLGRAPLVAELKQRLERVINLRTPVLLTGEPGWSSPRASSTSATPPGWRPTIRPRSPRLRLSCSTRRARARCSCAKSRTSPASSRKDSCSLPPSSSATTCAW